MRRALVTSKFRPWQVTLTAGAAALALPSAASAHGLPGSGAEGVLDHLWLGIRHMLDGWDHLLFIAGVMIVAGRSLDSSRSAPSRARLWSHSEPRSPIR